MITPGTQIDGYRIESFLGQGGMGAVYKAVRVDSEERVALKLLNRELAGSAQSLKEEARLNALVSSPFVVKVLGDGTWDGLPYVVQEFVDGPELRDGAADLTFDQKLDLSCQVGQGLSAAHKCGLIHRDLKPENIKIAADGTPKILDFGLARTFNPDELDESSFDEDGNIEGTLYYLSPEQLSGEKLTPGTDIFSYGVLFYELITGQRPFEGEYTASIVYSILHEEIIPPTDIDPDLPPWLNNITSKLLAKKNADRFKTIDEAVAFIEEHRREAVVPAAEWKRPTRKVTVIDLRNRSGDTDWDYFCEGFTEDVVRELTRRTDLIVSAEPSTSYSRDISQTFEKCRSDFIVSGSLLRWKENIKLNLRIHERDTETPIWSETFSDNSDNLFDLLDKAAREASGKLAEVTDSATIQIGDEFQPDVTAYDYYLKGRSYYQTNRPEDLTFAEEMFNKALEIEPQFAAAHAGLADVLVFRYMAFYDRSKENIQRAYDEATRAIQLDPTLPDGHRSIARYYMFTASLDNAEQSLLTAVEINPKYAIGYRTLGWLKRAAGDLEAAMAFTSKALELAPTDLETLLLLGLLNMDSGKLTAAMATLNRATELGPDYGRAYYYLGLVYMKLGALDAALKNLVMAEKYEGDPNCLIDAGMVYLMKGESEQARAKFEASIESEYFPFVAAYYLGLTAKLENDTTEATKQFERSVEMLKKFDLEGEENLHLKLYMAMALAGAGRQDDARKLILNLEDVASLTDDQRRDLARCYALLGDVDKAVRTLEEMMDSASGLTDKEIGMDPHFRDIPYAKKDRE